jgi:hypothetical protein
MTPTVLAKSVAALDPVRSWRLRELVRAGYRPWDAFLLSLRPDIDLHVAVGLLKEGCPVETALRILL